MNSRIFFNYFLYQYTQSYFSKFNNFECNILLSNSYTESRSTHVSPNTELHLSFSCRHNKDIALVNLANVLHRAHFSADAAVVVHAALDDSDFFTSYYTLGNIYAVNTTLCFHEPNQLLFPFLFKKILFST